MEKARARTSPAGGPQRWKYRRYSVSERPLPFGRRFEVFSPNRDLVLFCRCKRSDAALVFFADEDEGAELFRFEPQPLRHYQMAYQAVDSFTKRPFGYLRKKSYPAKKPEWFILNADQEQVGVVSEDAPRPSLLRRILPWQQVLRKPWSITWRQSIAGAIQPRVAFMGDRVDVDLGLDVRDEIDRRLVLGTVVAMRWDEHKGGANNHKRPAEKDEST